MHAQIHREKRGGTGRGERGRGWRGERGERGGRERGGRERGEGVRGRTWTRALTIIESETLPDISYWAAAYESPGSAVLRCQTPSPLPCLAHTFAHARTQKRSQKHVR